MATSAFWLTQINETEIEIASLAERRLIGVAKVENGEDVLDFKDRMKELRVHLAWLRKEYNNALINEGAIDAGCFVPKRETGL